MLFWDDKHLRRFLDSCSSPSPGCRVSLRCVSSAWLCFHDSPPDSLTLESNLPFEDSLSSLFSLFKTDTGRVYSQCSIHLRITQMKNNPVLWPPDAEKIRRPQCSGGELRFGGVSGVEPLWRPSAISSTTNNWSAATWTSRCRPGSHRHPGVPWTRKSQTGGSRMYFWQYFIQTMIRNAQRFLFQNISCF